MTEPSPPPQPGRWKPRTRVRGNRISRPRRGFCFRYHPRQAALKFDIMLARMAKAGKSRRTMVLVRGILKMALDDAIARRLRDWNPVAVTKVPRPNEAAQQRARAKADRQRNYRPEDEAALIRAAEGDRLEALWKVMAWAGLRPGEACGLIWDRIDLDHGLLTVDQARRNTGTGLSAPKGGEDGPSVRTVEIPAPLVAALKAHKARQAEEKLRYDEVWPETDAVFTIRLGTWIDRRSLERMFSKLTDKAGLGPDWHPHELRHLYISQSVDAGLSMTEVADAVGHARGSRVTFQVYAHRMRDVAGASAKAVVEARHA